MEEVELLTPLEGSSPAVVDRIVPVIDLEDGADEHRAGWLGPPRAQGSTGVARQSELSPPLGCHHRPVRAGAPDVMAGYRPHVVTD